jgi:hypothetical protein
LEPTSSENLISKYNINSTRQTGCVSIFGDHIGKPGDRIVDLLEVKQIDDALLFVFSNNDQITVENPQNIYIGNNSITIVSAEQIVWQTKSCHLRYSWEGANIAGQVITGNHQFKIDKSEVAFRFYWW